MEIGHTDHVGLIKICWQWKQD